MDEDIKRMEKERKKDISKTNEEEPKAEN